MRQLAKIVSYLFHPLLFPTYGAVFILAVNPDRYGPFGDLTQRVWLILIFALTFMFPAVWLAMMRGLQMIDNFKLENSKERIIPFVASATFYLWTAWMLKPPGYMKIPADPLLFHMMLGCCISVFIAFFINIYSKISLHALAAGSFLGLLLLMIPMSSYDLRMGLVGAICFAGLIGTARLQLGAHTLTQVFAGYFVGFTGQFIAFSILGRFF